MQKCFSKLKRGFAAFLVMLSLVGMVPFEAFDLTMTAFAAAPATITLKDFPSATGTSKPYYYYKSPLLGNGSSGKGQMAHEITIKAPDENNQIRERIAFCANNGKRLGGGCEGSKWGRPVEITKDSNKALHFVCYIGFYQYYAIKDDKDYLGDVPCLDAGNTRYWSEAATQAYIWSVKAQPNTFAALFSNWDDSPENRAPGTEPTSAGGRARWLLARERAYAGAGKLEAKNQPMKYTCTEGDLAGKVVSPTSAEAIWDSEMKLYKMAKGYEDGSLGWAIRPEQYSFWEYAGSRWYTSG